MVGENWLKVAVTAMALGVGLYIIPLAMIANPSIIALGKDPLSALVALCQIGIGLGLISHGLIASRNAGMKALLVLLGAGVVFGLH